MKKTPMPFQKIGARKIQKFGGRAVLADSMGLGKTLQVYLWIKWYLEAGPVVVVCPATLKEHWRRECLDCVDMNPKVLDGRTPPPRGLRISPDRLYIINPDIFGEPSNPDSWVNYLKSINPQLVVLDESHYYKTKDSKRTKAAKHLCDGVPHVVAVSGTPLTNRPAELWSVLNIVRPELFDNFWAYGSRYCAPQRTPWGWKYTGATHLDELHAILKKTCMIRRLKEDVLDDLPDKTRVVVPLKLSNRKEYDEAEGNFIRWLMKYSKSKAHKAAKSERLVQMGYLRRLSANLKLPAAVNWLDDYLEESDGKLLVFGIHKAVVRKLHEKYRKISVLVDGEVANKDRQRAIDSFNRDKSSRFFFGNVQAAGVGWSCTSASTVAFLEFPWTPGEVTQAEDRIHGIGRGTGAKAVIYSLVAENTIEEKLVKLLAQKQQVLSHTLDGDAGAGGFDLLDRLTESLLRNK